MQWHFPFGLEMWEPEKKKKGRKSEFVTEIEYRVPYNVCLHRAAVALGKPVSL